MVAHVAHDEEVVFRRCVEDWHLNWGVRTGDQCGAWSLLAGARNPWSRVFFDVACVVAQDFTQMTSCDREWVVFGSFPNEGDREARALASLGLVRVLLLGAGLAFTFAAVGLVFAFFSMAFFPMRLGDGTAYGHRGRLGRLTVAREGECREHQR